MGLLESINLLCFSWKQNKSNLLRRLIKRLPHAVNMVTNRSVDGFALIEGKIRYFANFRGKCVSLQRDK